MTDKLIEIGVGGVFAVVVIRTSFDFAKVIINWKGNRKNGDKKNGNGFISRTEFDEHRKVVQYRDTCQEIQKTISARLSGMVILEEERNSWQKDHFDKIDKQFSEVKSLISHCNYKKEN